MATAFGNDDFGLHPTDPLDTADVLRGSSSHATVSPSHRDLEPGPIEWLGQIADALLAQSAIDRLQTAA